MTKQDQERTPSRARRAARRAGGVALAGLVALVAAMAISVAGPTASAEAGSCTHRTGVYHADWTGRVYRQDWVCGNRAPSTVYLGKDHGLISGWLDTSRSWFVCWGIGQLHGGGNKVWYRTQSDRVNSGEEGAFRGWGWVPAYNVWTDVDPWVGMPAC